MKRNAQRILSLLLVALLILNSASGIVVATGSGGRKWFSLTGVAQHVCDPRLDGEAAGADP